MKNEFCADERINAIKEQPKTGGLYSNPGKTLKNIAKVIFFLGIVITVLIAIAVAALVADSSDSTVYVFDSIFAFILVVIIGAVLSYLGGLALAAFGDLVMNVNAIRRKIK